MAKPKDEYEVIRDTREQKGWQFDAEEFSSAICLGTRVDTMKTGDYTLVGYESVFCVERKGSVAEIARNLIDGAFERELKRMEAFEHRIIVCEFELEDVRRFPLGSGIPQTQQKLLQLTPQFLFKRLNEIIIQHKVPIAFAGKFGKDFTSSYFKRVIENVKKPVPV